MQPFKLFCTSSFGILAASLPAVAQSVVISLPLPSPRATVSQRVALTDITVTYHRPHVAGRKIFGETVPYGKVWRAGANDNTVVEFSDPVMVEGQPLSKGAYGLHMIPDADSFIVIFSKNSTSWGSFTYDAKEDALRVTVKPVTAEMHETLTYEFADAKPESAVLMLEWEKIAVPVRIEADREVTLTHIRNQLRTTPRRIWQGWNDAADWCVKNKTNLEEALTWSGRSIELDDRFENELTKSKVLAALNRQTEADTVRATAFEKGTAMQLFSFAENALISGRKDEAMGTYKMVAARFPDIWLGHLSKMRLDVAAGDFAGALKEIQAARAGAPEAYKTVLEDVEKRIEKKEDVNS